MNQEGFAIGEIVNKLNSIRFFYKYHAFEIENECRIIIKIPVDFDYSKTNILEQKFLTTNGVIKPNCIFKYQNASILKSVSISPIMETAIAQSGLKILLSSKGYKNVAISVSKIPIRY